MKYHHSIFTIVAVGFLHCSVFAQETYDYLGANGSFHHGVSLFEHQLYPASYQKFTALIDYQDLRVIPSDDQINVELMQALSAVYAGKSNATLMVQQFVAKYPNHPNASLAHLELGKYYFNHQQFDRALEQLNKVNASALNDDQRIDYNMSYGYTLFIKKRFKEAQPYLQSVHQSVSPYQKQATYYLALSYYFEKNYKEAQSLLAQLENDPRYGPDIPYYYSRILFDQHQYQEVIDYLEPKMNTSLRNTLEVNQILGQSYFNLQQYQKALPYLERYSQETTKQSPEALYQLAYTQYQLGYYQEAVRNFEQLNIVSNELGQYALYALAESYLKIDDKEKSIQAFDRAAQMNFNPKISETAAFNKAKLSAELGRNNVAIDLLKNFIATYASSQYTQEAKELLVDVLLTTTNYQEALNVLEGVSNRTARMSAALQKASYYRAVELYNTNNHGAAKPLFEQAITTGGDQRYSALSNYWLGEMAYEYNRYALAETYFNKFLSSGIQIPEQYQDQCHYSLGYCYYNQDNYNEASKYFQKVPASQSFGADAKLRQGDALFVQKNYNAAKRAYQSLINANPTQKDYAAFQLAILTGLQGQNQSKLNQLQQIYGANPNSPYADDALFEEGRAYFAQENYGKAEQVFQQFIKQYPQSELLRQGYNQIGLLYFNQSNYEDALVNYEVVVKQFPNSDEASAALQAIKEIYIVQGRADDYLVYLRTVPGASISNSEAEELLFLSGETPFKNGDCATAKKAFDNYLNQYANGYFAANAHFYRGECLNQSNQIEAAMADFAAVANLANNKFSERSMIRLARYYYRANNYEDAVKYYVKLSTLSPDTESIYEDEIEMGLMQSYNRLNQRQDAYPYAEMVSKQEQVSPGVLAEAKFIMAWSMAYDGRNQAAIPALEASIKDLNSQYGAEARYLIAKSLQNLGNYEQSTEAAYRVSDETPSEDDWVALSFILIGENYAQLGELFQAKATVQSVLDNYKGSNQKIIQEAQGLLESITAQEAAGSTIQNTDSTTNQLQLRDE